jgi:hypothetical protein
MEEFVWGGERMKLTIKLDKKKIENFKQNIKDAFAFGIIEKENYERIMRMISEIEKHEYVEI